MNIDFIKDISKKFNSFSATVDGSGKLASVEMRQSAIDMLIGTGLPTKKNEDWKYTPLSFLNELDFIPLTTATEEPDREFINTHLLDDSDANILVLINGKFSKEFSRIKNYDNSDLFIGSLKDAANHSEKFSDIISKSIASQKDVFVNLNVAFTLDGAFVFVPAGFELNGAIHILSFVDARNINSMVNQRNLIVAGENSNVKLIETVNVFGNQAAFVNNLMEIYVQKYAKVNYLKFQNDDSDLYNIGYTFVEQDEDSAFESNAITMKSKFVRNTLNVLHKGQHCESSLSGFYFLEGNEFADNHTLIDHAQANNHSKEIYKGIVGGKAKAVFDGKIIVRPDAQHTESYQSNKNILLSDDATINTTPQLEIYADDVKCSHGATSGSIDEDSLFYLRARGIGEAKARALLLDGFAEEIIDKISDIELNKSIKRDIRKRLNITDDDICYSCEDDL